MQIRESTQFGPKPLVVDEDQQIIYGVKVIGQESKNGKVFTPACRQNAHRLIEGLKVNVNHKKKGEDVIFSSRLGKLRNPREEADGTYADLHYLKTNPLTPMVLEAATRDPGLCGLSILGQGRGKNRDVKGRTIVESITDLQSADIVADPANTVGLNESDQTLVSPTLREAEEEAGTGPSCEELAGLLIAKLMHEGKHDQANDHLKVVKKHTASEEKDEDEDEPEVEESTKEARRANCLELCESHKVKPVDGLMVVLMAARPGDRAQVVTAWKGSTRVRPPKSGSPSIPIEESHKPTTNTAEDSFERILKGLGRE